ncbi:MAG TPA: hypothetical protein VES02_05995, partial [Dermatophilaceae bacterium]|nr:hypothetical protein [Dermatophilaceae bacterium]
MFAHASLVGTATPGEAPAPAKIPVSSSDGSDGAAQARSHVEDGSSVAALVVDLRGTRDILFLSPSR